MTGPYKRNGQATLWPAVKGDSNWNQELVESLIDYTGYNTEKEEVYRDEAWLGGHSPSTFETEEIYVDTHNGKHLHISGSIEEIHTSIYIPIEDNESMRQIVKDLVEVVDINPDSSGLFLKPSDFDEVRTKTADGQGRINLGIDRAGKDVKVVILDG